MATSDATFGHYILAPHAMAFLMGWWPLGCDVDVERGCEAVA